MSFTQQLESVKELIESLPESPKVEIFNGVFNDDVLKAIKLDGNRPHILIGCGGGPFTQNAPKLEVEAAFVALVIGKSDKTGQGNSKIATDCAKNLAIKISKYRGNPQINTSLPMLQSIEELSSGMTNGLNYSVWAVDWTQKMVLV